MVFGIVYIHLWYVNNALNEKKPIFLLWYQMGDVSDEDDLYGPPKDDEATKGILVGPKIVLIVQTKKCINRA